MTQNGILLEEIPSQQKLNISTTFQPLVTLQCDTKNFVSQIQRNWKLYTSTKWPTPATPPLYVKPDCNSFLYRHFRWTPESWNMLEHKASAKNFDFEMLNFDIIEKPLYIITDEIGLTEPHDMFFSEASDTIAFISYTLSHFYETYQSIRFKLVTKDKHWPQTQTGSCFVALKRLPLIKTPLHTFGSHIINNPTQCVEAKLVRLHKISTSTFALDFPRGKLINQVPLFRNYDRYIEQTGHLDVLDFQWSTPEDTGYTLLIEVGPRLRHPPKIWWILRQSDSLLGYHDNFFAPEYLRISQVIYSYARGRKHDYADELYVKSPDTKYLRQNVIETNYTLQSWLLPQHENNFPEITHEYCKTRLGPPEHNLIEANKFLDNPSQTENLRICKNNAKIPQSTQRDRLEYHQKAITAFPTMNYDIFSYDTRLDNHYSEHFLPLKLNTAPLQRALNDEKNLLNMIWTNMKPKIQTLQMKRFLHHIYNNERLFFRAERQIYDDSSNPHTKYFIHWGKEVKAEKLVTLLLNEIIYIRNYLTVVRTSIQNYFQTMYLLTLTQLAMSTLKQNQSLQPHTLYQHILTNGELISSPVKRNAAFFTTTSESIFTSSLWGTTNQAVINDTWLPEPYSKAVITFTNRLPKPTTHIYYRNSTRTKTITTKRMSSITNLCPSYNIRNITGHTPETLSYPTNPIHFRMRFLPKNQNPNNGTFPQMLSASRTTPRQLSLMTQLTVYLFCLRINYN